MRDENKTKKELIAELVALRNAKSEDSASTTFREAYKLQRPHALLDVNPAIPNDSPQIWKSILEQIHLGIGIWKLENPGDSGSLRYIHRNPAADEATKAPLRKFIGTTMRENFPLLMDTELPSTLLDVIRTGKPAELGEFVYGDEDIPEANYSVKVFHLGEEYVGISFENVTEISRAVKEREEALAALETANKEESRRLAVEQSALAEIGRIVSSSLNIEEVYEGFAEAVRKLIPFDRILISIVNPEDSTFNIPYVAGIEVPNWGNARKSPLAGSLTGEVVASGRTIVVSADGEEEVASLGARHRLVRAAIRAGVRTFMVIPLIAGDRVMGALFLESSRPDAYDLQKIRLAENIAGQISGTIANTLLFEQLEAGHNQLRSLTQQVIEAQEKERQYVSRELHDEAGQALTALKISLQIVQSELTDDTTAVMERIKGAVALTDATMENIRMLARGLRPLELDALGLPGALEGYCREFAELTGMTIQYSGYDAPELSEATNICLYRYLQEALTNVAKHARANKVHVELSNHSGEVELTVFDDGLGFSRKAHASESNHSRGIGLLGMQERFEALGGRIDVESKAGKGTRLAAYVPVREGE